MSKHDFYVVDGCTEFIPVTINERYTGGVDVTIHGPIRPFRTTVEQVYQFQKPHEPQKVVVPKFVAEWIEELKKYHSNLAWVWQIYPNEPKAKNWLEANIEKFMRAWLDGFEIEKEKLYTVRIPNPNRTSFPYTLYRKDDGKIIIIGAGDDYEKREEYQLTEAEIKQDFEWAWQFAKEVE